MNRLFVFGDSFSQPHGPDDNFSTYYHSVANDLNAEYFNFSKGGTGPEYSMRKFHEAMFAYKFGANDYIIILLSDPGREYVYHRTPPTLLFANARSRFNYGFENIRNLIYLSNLSESFYQDVKIFCSVIWNDTTFYDGIVLSNENSIRFFDDTSTFPSPKFRSKNFQKLNNVENFYYCDCELGVIQAQEFSEIYSIHQDEKIKMVFHFTKEKRHKTFQVDTIDDFRINHISQRTHDTFAKLIIDFFLYNKKPVNTDNMFEKGFLMADDPYVKIRKEFIYE